MPTRRSASAQVFTMNKHSKRLLLITAVFAAAASICFLIPQFGLELFSLGFYFAALLLTVFVGIFSSCTLLRDRSFSTATRPSSRFEHKAEFLVLCDEAMTVVENNDFANTDIRFLKQIRQDGRPCTLDQFIHPEDIDVFRAQIAGCSFLVPTVTNVRLLAGDLTGRTYVSCRCRSILCPYKDFASQPAVKLSFTLASSEHLSATRSRDLLKSFSCAAWEYDIATDTVRYTPVSAQSENFSLRGRDLISFVSDTLVLHPDFKHTVRQLCHSFITGAEDINVDLKLMDISGDYRWYTLSGVRVYDDAGRLTGYIGRLRNTDNNSSKISHAINPDEDPLTGLFNRHGLERHIDRRLSGSDIHSCALILIDVDDYASIVQQLGRHFGDALLIDIAALLRSGLSESNAAGHITSDTFAVAILNPESKQQVAEQAARLSQAMSHIHLSQDRSSTVTCGLGIAFSSTSECTYELLYYQADTALSYAKSKGKGQIEIFHDELDYIISADAPRTPTVETQPQSILPAEDFVSQAIDVLSQARELSSSVNIVLSLIGNKYGLRSCEILEFSDDYKSVHSTYRWNENHNTGSAPVQCSLELISKTVALVGDSEYHYCPSVAELAKAYPDIAGFYLGLRAGSFLHIPIRDGLRISGLICYGGRENVSSFGSDVTREIVMISKVMAGYIMLLRTQQSMYRITTTDTLTGCLNMGRFTAEARRILLENPQQRYVIVYSDIDRFKFINETFGYLAGDRVLIEFTHIIADDLGEDELLGRIEADKFIVLLRSDGRESLVARLSEYDRRMSSLSTLLQSSYKIPLRCGIAHTSPEDEISHTIDMANLARKSVKNIHVSTYIFYDKAMKSRILQQKEIEDTMHEALDNGEFAVYLQPKFSLEDNHIVGAEALVRWLRPEHGIQRPDEFIPIFEDNGFVIELDFYVLERVCQKLRHDLDSGLSPLPISVNFSRLHLNAEDFSGRIRKCLDTYGISPDLIEIEITESALIGNEDYLVEMMNTLHDIGLSIAMDDFGSGYSTLNLLKKLPVDILKIDKAFLTDNGSDRERLIIANVVNMAKSLNIRVVSEGVETAEQAEFLRRINCDIAQGYHYAKPMDIETYESTCQQGSASL